MRNLKALLLGGALALSGVLSTVVPAQAETTFRWIYNNQWSAANFNPFLTPANALVPTFSAIYEPLFFINVLNGEVVPLLGIDYAWSEDSLSLTVSIREGVTWTDGTPLTPADVAFTFNLMQQYPALDREGVWSQGLSSVTVDDAGKVVFGFERPNIPLFFYINRNVIVPEHIWSAIADPVTFTNEAPVGSGPFILDQYTQQGVRLVKNQNFWMDGKPAFDVLEVPSVAGNDAALLMMLSNEAEWFFGGITNPQGDYADRGENFKYWWPVESFNFLYFNTTKAPFDDPAFRRAIAGALDVNDIAEKAYSGAINGASQIPVIPTQVADWVDSSIAELTVPFDPAAAAQALTDAGYLLNDDGQRLGLDGQPLASINLLTGAGWGDYITILQLTSESLAELGIPSVIDQQAFPTYAASIQQATYDIALSWGWGSGSSPYYLLNRSFNSALSAPVGETAVSNLSRYTRPEIDAALATFEASSDPAVQKEAINTILGYVVADMPWVPVTERARFTQYNTTNFTGFPDADNPYNSGESIMGSVEMMLLNVVPRE